MTSCLVRNDYNIIFSILLLLVLSTYYNQNPQISSKIIVHLLSMLVGADIIWIITMSVCWVHPDKGNAMTEVDLFWNSLQYLHGFVYVLAYIELVLKALLIYYLFTDFKTKYNWKELFNFSYLKQDLGNASVGRPIGETMGQGNMNGPNIAFANNY